jgi:drug/metabolite transporter (DMT)-like permease
MDLIKDIWGVILFVVVGILLIVLPIENELILLLGILILISSLLAVLVLTVSYILKKKYKNALATSIIFTVLLGSYILALEFGFFWARSF